MSKSAFSAKVFAVYLFVIGPVLVFAPNVLLAIFRIPPVTDVWIRILGVVVFNLGIYAWVAARHENRSFLEASVHTRLLAFVAFAMFAVTGLGSPMLILFGTIELGGALWTWFALKADARPVRAAAMAQH